MLRGLLGFGNKDGRPPPPKGKIEVVCPACGAVQYEPRLVVSTFCRKCGVHLSVAKKKITASTTIGPLPPRQPAPAPVTVEKAPLQTREDFAEPTAPAQEESAPPEMIDPADDAAEMGFGTMLQKAAAQDSENRVRTDPTTRGKPRSNMPAPTPAPPPASESTLKRMKDQGFYRNQYFKDAQCFDCEHAFKVGRSARSTNCPQCGALISLEDIEINMDSTQSIKTRGDVMIRKRGHLSASSVQCKDIRCHGLLEANVHCSGDALFRTSGTVVGEIRCHRFIIEKGADVTFVNSIYANEVEIHAKVTATIFARGSVLISSYGAVNGDVTARSVSIEPGGELNGAMNIIRADSPLFTPITRPAD